MHVSPPSESWPPGGVWNGNPGSLSSLERNIRSWTHASMRSLWPCSDSSRTPSFPSQLELKIGLPRANPRETWNSCRFRAYGWFMLRFDRKQQNSIKKLSFNKKINRKKRIREVSYYFNNIIKQTFGCLTNDQHSLTHATHLRVKTNQPSRADFTAENYSQKLRLSRCYHSILWFITNWKRCWIL